MGYATTIYYNTHYKALLSFEINGLRYYKASPPG